MTGFEALKMQQGFVDYYRCPDRFVDFQLSKDPETANSLVPSMSMYKELRTKGSTCILPFNPTAVADNLRYERYVNRSPKPAWKQAIRNIYYALRPALPVPVRRHLQRTWLKGWKTAQFPAWPVDRTVDQMFETLMSLLVQTSEAKVPFIWFWPEGKSSCAIMTHDVETNAGLKFIPELMNMDDSFGIKSSFQLIPEARYTTTNSVLTSIRDRGFEVNVHDLKHDGRLYEDHGRFLKSAARINEHADRFGSQGFRSGALYRNLEWYDAFTFSYDMSVPSVGHLDPQPGGCCTVMPYFVGNILELPVTTIQDYSLFHVLNTYSLDLWQQQTAAIREQHGMISVIVHPDYLNTNEARNCYQGLLKHLRELREEAQCWTALPQEVNTWWRERSQMNLVANNGGWRVEGPGAERARVAYATLRDGKVEYVVN